MKRDVVIRVEGLSKQFALRHSESAIDNGNSELWALKDVSFEINRGDSVGIIGPNGSGKSTLLKVLGGITKPTSGKVEMYGRVGSILDIGAGFHPELSGRENVYLNGQLHGFSNRELQFKLDEIVDFSGIRSFIDEPVKNYSNGMFLRLAFSIMAHLDFDIYLFDEVFSVGDAAFRAQARSIRAALQSRTVLTVSHNLDDLSNCDRIFWMKNGRLNKVGQTNELISDYLEATMKGSEEVQTENFVRTDFSSIAEVVNLKIQRFELSQPNNTGYFRTDLPFVVNVQYLKSNSDYALDVMMLLKDANDKEILALSSFVNGAFSDCEDAGEYSVTFTVPAFFLNARIFKISLLFYADLGLEFSKPRDTIVLAGVGNDQGNSNIILKAEDMVAFRPELRLASVRKTDTSNSWTSCNFLVGLDWVQKQRIK